LFGSPPTRKRGLSGEDYVLDDFVQTHAGYHDAENFENPARAEDQRNEVRLAFGVVWFRS